MNNKKQTPEKYAHDWLDQSAQPEDKALHRPCIIAYLKSCGPVSIEELSAHAVFKGAAKEMAKRSKRWRALKP